MKTYYLMNYVPVSAGKYGYTATPQEVTDRKEVWNFKDGSCSRRILNGLANGIRKIATTNTVVCFVPASTWERTELRYEEVAKRLHDMTGIPCSYTAICKDCDEKSGHTSVKKDDPAEDFSFETSFFKGKKVILIDDVITRGNTLNCTARRLIKYGALDVTALTVARTFNPLFQHADTEKYLVCA